MTWHSINFPFVRVLQFIRAHLYLRLLLLFQFIPLLLCSPSKDLPVIAIEFPSKAKTIFLKGERETGDSIRERKIKHLGLDSNKLDSL
jgi:hypothetical protein